MVCLVCSWHQFLSDFTANHGVVLLNALDVGGVVPDSPGQSRPGPPLIKLRCGSIAALESSAARKSGRPRNAALSETEEEEGKQKRTCASSHGDGTRLRTQT